MPAHSVEICALQPLKPPTPASAEIHATRCEREAHSMHKVTSQKPSAPLKMSSNVSGGGDGVDAQFASGKVGSFVEGPKMEKGSSSTSAGM